MKHTEPRQPRWLHSIKGAPFTGIGSLEAEVLTIVWDHARTTVRDVYETLRERRQIAYTTVMTVMNNLVKKGLLTRDKKPIAHVYAPAIPGREVAEIVLDSVVDRLLKGRSNVAVSHLLGLERELTPEQFEELRALARERFAA